SAASLQRQVRDDPDSHKARQVETACHGFQNSCRQLGDQSNPTGSSASPARFHGLTHLIRKQKAGKSTPGLDPRVWPPQVRHLTFSNLYCSSGESNLYSNSTKLVRSY